MDIEVDGITVRLDVQTNDASKAAEVAETLARMSAGFAAEGLVASMIVHPAEFTIEDDLEVHSDDEAS